MTNESTPATTDDDMALAVLAAALGMTCVDPRDDADIGFCRAGRHSVQAVKVLNLLRSQGWTVTRDV